MKKIYFININDLKESFSYEEIYKKVSLYRKRKVDKLIFENDKWLSLGGEYLLMKGLEELKIDYSKIEIGYVENNKPILKNCKQKLYFNISHSDEMAMCVISNSEVRVWYSKNTGKNERTGVGYRYPKIRGKNSCRNWR